MTLKYERISKKDGITEKFDIPMDIGYYALKHFKKDTKKDIKEMESEEVLMETLFWYGMVAGYKDIGKENPFEKEDVEWILNKTAKEFLKILSTELPKENAKKK